MRLYLNFLLTLNIFFLSCHSIRHTTVSNKNTIYDYSSKSFKVNGLLVIARHSTEFDKLIKFNNDTLAIAVNSAYVYFPFGRIKAGFAPDLGLLRNFSLNIDTLRTDIGDTYLQILKHKSSTIIYSFNPTYIGSDSDLFNGEINDADVEFANGIKIGLSADDFYAYFFEKLPTTLKSKYKCFILESSDGITHTYLFEDNKLKSVKFTRVVYWKLAYNPLSE